mmetsp:Transcript_18289/g.17408  ORF Transcript_18289/g.17408 Transcript_18289/m.17408 type:complete len:169 (+) Transcript_18289:431-937(+)
MYIFGGRDSQDEAFGKLIILKIQFNLQGELTYKYQTPATLGKAPSARYCHTQNFYREGNFMIIAYGRNDKDKNPSNVILNDIWILKLASLEWQQVKHFDQSGDAPMPRFNHCSMILGSRLLIVGGIGEGFKITKDIQEIEIDQQKICKSTMQLKFKDEEREESLPILH